MVASHWILSSNFPFPLHCFLQLVSEQDFVDAIKVFNFTLLHVKLRDNEIRVWIFYILYMELTLFCRALK